MNEEDKLKIINFIQDFGCCSLKQLQILFNRPDDNFKNILTSNLISKKNDILVHNRSKIDTKMISALDVLCKYKKNLKQFHKGLYPVYITFIKNDNTLYNIIVISKEDEKGVLKLLKNESPLIPEADKFILLFEDAECLGNIECNTPYIYCLYPEIKILTKKS